MADDKYEFLIVEMDMFASILEKKTMLNEKGEAKWTLWAIMPRGKMFEYYFSKKKP